MVAALVAALAGAADAATFSVNPTQIFLTGKSGSALLTLRNDSTEPLRFQLTAFTWQQTPGGEIKLEPTKDVVFFPALLALKPGEERRVRIGSLTAAAAREQTYRIFVEELPPVDSTSTGAAVKVLTKMGIPIFVRPATERAAMTLDGLGLEGDRLKFTVGNEGSVHVVPGEIVARANDASGATVFERTVPGWYILAGGRRDFDLDMASPDCARVATYAVTVQRESETLTRTLPAVPGACTQK
jgi:fimbrial chaperone protein